jgi:hypothetical protein
MRPAKRYLWTWLLGTFAIIGAVALFNLLVDPYGVYRIVTISGFNGVKSQASQRALLFKRHAAERARPNTLVLGNSRAEIGFDPESSAWPAAVRPVFNMALPGTGVFTAVEELQNFLRTGSAPRLLVVGVDFLDFRTHASTSDLDVPAQGSHSAVREHALSLVTASALVDSLATVKAQYDPYPTSLTDMGFNPMRDYVGIARREGYGVMFWQRDGENARNWARGPKSIYLADGGRAPEYRALERMMAIAARERIELRFVVYPYHAHSLVLFDQAGLWPAFESWKRELVKSVESRSAGGNVELWDFSGFSPYADETVPPRGETRSELKWYWEAGHFKKSLGDVLLTRMLSAERDLRGWGRRLMSSVLEEHLADQRAALAMYKATHAKDTAELAALVAAALPIRAAF